MPNQPENQNGLPGPDPADAVRALAHGLLSCASQEPHPGVVAAMPAFIEKVQETSRTTALSGDSAAQRALESVSCAVQRTLDAGGLTDEDLFRLAEEIDDLIARCEAAATSPEGCAAIPAEVPESIDGSTTGEYSDSGSEWVSGTALGESGIAPPPTDADDSIAPPAAAEEVFPADLAAIDVESSVSSNTSSTSQSIPAANPEIAAESATGPVLTHPQSESVAIDELLAQARAWVSPAPAVESADAAHSGGVAATPEEASVSGVDDVPPEPEMTSPPEDATAPPQECGIAHDPQANADGTIVDASQSVMEIPTDVAPTLLPADLTQPSGGLGNGEGPVPPQQPVEAPASTPSLSIDDVLELDTLSGLTAVASTEPQAMAIGRTPEVITPESSSIATPEDAPIGSTPSPTPVLVDAADARPTIEAKPESIDETWASIGCQPLPTDQFEQPLTLGKAQQELLAYVVTDLEAATASLRQAGSKLVAGELDAAVADLQQLAGATEKTMTFFGHQTLVQTSQLISAVAAEVPAAAPAAREGLARVLGTLASIWGHCARALARGVEQRWPLDPLLDKVAEAISAGAAPSQTAQPSIDLATPNPGSSPEQALELSPETLQSLVGDESSAAWGTTPIVLSAERADALQFAINDLKLSADALTPLATQLSDLGSRDEVRSELLRLSGLMEKAIGSFGFKSLNTLITLVGDVGAGLETVSDAMMPELSVRFLAIQSLVQQHATALEVGMETTWPLKTLEARVHRLLEGKRLAEHILGWHKGGVDRVSELDLVIEGIDPPPKVEAADDASAWVRPAVAINSKNAAGRDIVKIDASVIEGLLSNVGEVVQHRARLQMLGEQLRVELPGHPLVEEICRASETLERSMVTLQTGIMGTRLQRISRLFDNYPRVLRDVGRSSDREVAVQVVGGDTLVDKSILDALAEPLMAILRFTASCMIEKPADRTQAGKPTAGTVRLSAHHQGSQVLVMIEDDGGGYRRLDAAIWIVESGLMTREQADALGDDEMAAMLFESDVTQSPLCRVAGLLQRGLGSTFSVRNMPGKGSRIELVIPMKSAILPAVLVAAGQCAYTIPLQAIIEITKLERSMIKTIASSPCLRLRDEVFPLLDARTLFGEEPIGEPGFAIVLTTGQRRAALAVDRVINKQDMIISQIDDARLRRGPFSGTTLTLEGRVSLVLDVQRVLNDVSELGRMAAASV